MRVLFLWPLCLVGFLLPAQTPPAGVLPEWEARNLLTSLTENVRKLEPLLGEIKPAEWIAQGAPDTYQLQATRVSESLQWVKYSTGELARQPNKLHLAVDAMFRMDTLQMYLSSLAAGVRKYQNPALADLLLGVADENSSNRDALKRYVLELAKSKDEELRVMDAEAQRCVGMLATQAPPNRPKPVAPKPKPAVAPTKDRP